LQQLPGQESKEGRLLFTSRETGNSAGAQADAVPETIFTRSVATPMVFVSVLVGMVAVGYLVGTMRTRRSEKEIPSPFGKNSR
jgi:hypothetical protein